jgi:PAS domain S-box-containing protein
MMADKSWRILYVDNDEEDHYLVRTMLGEAHRQRVMLDWACSLEDGRDRLNANIYDAVLVDYDLGTETGIDLVREFTSRGYQAPFILLTERCSYDPDVEAMMAGATLYLSKNEINPLLLERSIRYAIERKRTEEALRFSEEKFLTIFQRSPTPIVLLSLPEGRFVDANQAYLDLTGFSSEELIGHTTLELGIVHDSMLRKLTYDSVEAKGYARGVEVVTITKTGEERNLVANFERIVIEGSAYLIGTMVDITKRNRAEIELRQLAVALEMERAKLAAAFDQLPVGVGIGDPHGQMLSLNAVGLKLHGFASLEEMYTSLDQYTEAFDLRYMDGRLVPLEDWPVCRAMRGEYVQDYELRLCHKPSGAERIITYSAAPVCNSQGETVQIVYVMQDMTGRTAAQEALQASETRFRELADSMPQLVWIARPDGSVEYYNYRYREFDGIARNDAGNWLWKPAVHPADLQRTVDAWQHAVATGELYQIEHRVRMADGSYRWHLSRGVPAFDDSGKLVKWYGTATDVDELQKARAGLVEYAARLKRSNEELESFALVASHDLQEPLRKIRLFGDRLHRQLEGQLSQEAADDLDRMQNAAVRMQAMIDGLLELSRIDRSQRSFAVVDLNQLAAEVVSDLEGRIQACRGQVILTDLPAVTGDAIQIRQLLQNLIGNALKFQRQGVLPVVQVSGELNDGITGRVVHIRVADNGIGFDADHAGRIFQPFTRLHPRREYEGSGIGLAICRKIAERHGGSIQAYSQPGQGSVFEVLLPATMDSRGDS